MAGVSKQASAYAPPSAQSQEPAQSQVQPSSKPAKASVLDLTNFPQHLSSETVYIELRYDTLDTAAALRFTRSPSCGANVLFLGTTRNNFDNRPVSRLSYSAYPALALKSLFAIADDVRRKHGLEKVYIAHRLGEVGIEEESIAVAVSSGHRGAGWRGAEEVLERVKARAEIWKREWFADTGEGDWRANRDRDGEGRAVTAQAHEQKAAIEAGGQHESARQAASPSALQAKSPPSTQQHDDGSGASDSKTTHQTSKELDSDIANYIASMTQKLRM